MSEETLRLGVGLIILGVALVVIGVALIRSEAAIAATLRDAANTEGKH